VVTSHRKNGSIISNLVSEFFATEARSWHGEEPLWKVFWIYGVARSGIIAAFYAVAIYADYVVLQQMLLVCFATYTIWILVSVWRCANNIEEKSWGLLARLLTVAWAGNTIMVLTFLQFDLLTKYLGR
jgi:hypothetical protein